MDIGEGFTICLFYVSMHSIYRSLEGGLWREKKLGKRERKREVRRWRKREKEWENDGDGLWNIFVFFFLNFFIVTIKKSTSGPIGDFDFLYLKI